MEEQKLSFKDKYITPLTKEYKDFIHERENTPSEVFHRDGERQFTEKELKFMQIYEQKQPKLGKPQIYSVVYDNIKIGGEITEIAGKTLTDKDYLHLFDEGTKNTIEMYIKANPNTERIKLTPQDNLAMAKRWQKEINNPTEMSKGMTINRIAEKASEYYDLYQEKEKQELKEENLKTYDIVKNGTIQGEVKAENKEEAFITVSERYGEENFRLIEKEPEIKLYENDRVILNEKDEFVKFNDGQIMIYGDEEEAEADKMKGDKVVNVLDLDDEKQTELKENIAEFREIKTERNVPNREWVEEELAKLSILEEKHINNPFKETLDLIKNKIFPKMDKQQELAEDLLEKVKKDFTPNEQFLISEFARLRNYKPVDIDDEVMDLAMVYQKSENFIDNASISKETINKVNKFLDENVSEVKDKDKVLLSSFVNEMHNDIEFSNQMKEVYKQAEMTAWDTEEDLTINTKQQNMDNEINKEKINSFIDATVFVNKNETTQEHTERYTQKWNELNAEEKAYVKEKGADIAVSSIGEAYYEDTFMPREKENEIILDFNSKVEKLISQSQQTVKNMEAITPQENVKEILNEIQEKLNPKEKAFLELKMIEFIGSKHNLGMAEVGNHLTYEEIQNVNQYLSKLEEKYFNPIEDEDFGLVDENYNKLLSKVVYEMETNNAFMNDVNPIFLEVAQNIQKRKEQFNIIEHLNNQMKYLGFGDNHKEEIQKGIDSNDKSFQIKTTSDKALFGNKAEFAVNFNKSEKGGVFLNSFDAKLTTSKGEERSQNFRLNFTAKEAINLLEGRAVKTELLNKQGEKFNAFVKLNFAEEKNEFGNYKSKLFNENYGVDTGKIVDELKLKFDKPEYRENAIKSLEKGNIIKAKFEHEGKEIQGKAFLNVEYKTLNLYNDKMQRLNNNKPLQGLAQDNSHEKNNVREQSISRGI